MYRRGVRTRLVVVACLFFAATAAWSELATLDVVPAATLLLPYFEVDAGGTEQTARTVHFSITNTSDSMAITHVVLWTDFGIPTLSLDAILPARGSRTYDLRDFFRGATIPGNGGEIDLSGSSPGLLEAHSGQPISGTDFCSGFDHGDGLARGYITIDAMNEANAGFPGDTGYFVDGGTGDASNDNILWGEYVFVDASNGTTEGDTMVHIEADENLTGMTAYTFYARQVGFDGADNREPLNQIFSAPTVQDTGAGTTTQLIYWRDTKVDSSAVQCDAVPTWFPLTLTLVVEFDSEGEPLVTTPEVSLPLACGITTTGPGTSTFSVSEDAAWTFLNLSLTTSAEFGNSSQCFVAVQTSTSGGDSSRQEAIALQTAFQ